MGSRPTRSAPIVLAQAAAIVAVGTAIAQLVGLATGITIGLAALLAFLWLINRVMVGKTDSAQASSRTLKAAPLPAHRYLTVIAIVVVAIGALTVATLNQGSTRIVAFGIVIIAGLVLAELRTASYRPILTQRIPGESP